ncbi:hypothetical protein DPMN_104919 [Dreissena polymorpha]|uniref:Uncharacterized protein n=1 Tax=Dreissena polymorpha TaxID=45954 RepID=A0A9D4K201_DREPO|nr:hypothetical protein DPMN_104919 [Dreissena polymorpha]
MIAIGLFLWKVDPISLQHQVSGMIAIGLFLWKVDPIQTLWRQLSAGLCLMIASGLFL